MTQENNYFVSFGTRVNEYQVWNYAQIVCRSPSPQKVIEYLVEAQKIAKEKIRVHCIPPTDSLEKKIKDALGHETT